MEVKNSILIIDDNSDNLRVAANILKAMPINIYIANSGKKGIDIALLKRPDLILLDIQMPELDGYEVCRMIKENEEIKNTPIIFMTANTDETSIEKAFDLGAVDYITKPIKSGELLARAKTQMELAKTIDELKKANSVKNKFFSIISHDLRGPISGMSLLYKVILEEYEKYTLKNLYEVIFNSAEAIDRTYALLENLLQWAKTQTGSFKYRKIEIDLRSLIKDAVEIAIVTAKNKNIEITNNALKEMYIEGDQYMIETIIRNLLNNAVKYTEKNGKIDVYTNIIEDKIEVTIEDNGVGMSKETKESLLQIDKTQSIPGTFGEKGSGLGLFLCDEFIKINGGEFKIESEEGVGSRFSFTLNKITLQ